MKELFSSERLAFRLFTLKDMEECYAIWGSDKVMQDCGGPIDYALLPQIIDFYNHSQTEYGLSVYAVVEQSSKEIIGAIGFNIEDSIEEAELIYHFREDKWGYGFATEACLATLNFAKDTTTISHVAASASIHHPPSLHILQKLGFEYLGIHFYEDTKQEEAFFRLSLS